MLWIYCLQSIRSTSQQPLSPLDSHSFFQCPLNPQMSLKTLRTTQYTVPLLPNALLDAVTASIWWTTKFYSTANAIIRWMEPNPYNGSERLSEIRNQYRVIVQTPLRPTYFSTFYHNISFLIFYFHHSIVIFHHCCLIRSWKLNLAPIDFLSWWIDDVAGTICDMRLIFFIHRCLPFFFRTVHRFWYSHRIWFSYQIDLLMTLRSSRISSNLIMSGLPVLWIFGLSRFLFMTKGVGAMASASISTSTFIFTASTGDTSISKMSFVPSFETRNLSMNFTSLNLIILHSAIEHSL